MWFVNFNLANECTCVIENRFFIFLILFTAVNSSCYTLTKQYLYQYSLRSDLTILVSHKCPIIGGQVVVISMTNVLP